MSVARFLLTSFVAISLCFLCYMPLNSHAEEVAEITGGNEAPSQQITDSEDLPPLDNLPPPSTGPVTSPEATIINAHRNAVISSEVSGIIEVFHYDEGDLVPQGNVVAEISKRRYTLIAQKGVEALKGQELAFSRAEQQVKILRELLSFDATTKQELLKAETDRDVSWTRVQETKKELALAQLNLEACQVTAPFAGYLAVRYKQPFEAVERLEKVFSIVDTASVYAVANVSEEMAPAFKKGAPAVFINSAGGEFVGVVERIGKLIDPKSRTKRFFVLIDNSKAQLEVGMTGSLKPGQPRTR